MKKKPDEMSVDELTEKIVAETDRSAHSLPYWDSDKVSICGLTPERTYHHTIHTEITNDKAWSEGHNGLQDVCDKIDALRQALLIFGCGLLTLIIVLLLSLR